MKPARLAILSAVLVLSLVGVLASAGLEGSKHDFSNQEWTGGDRCVACHTAEAEEPPTTGPLWDPQADLSRTFGTRLGDTPGPGPGTLICLRCHDGTIARDSVGGIKTERYRHKLSPSLTRTGHGRSDHPVGVRYPSFDKHYRPMILVLGKRTVLLPGGKVECTSCHDPHDEAGLEAMLVTSNARSRLCLTCHKK